VPEPLEAKVISQTPRSLVRLHHCCSVLSYSGSEVLVCQMWTSQKTI